MSSDDVLGGTLGARVLRGEDEALDDAIDALTSARLTSSFWQGFTGLAWLINRSGELEREALDPIDEAIIQLLDRDEWLGHYDLINGLVGLGLYAIERGHPRMLELTLHHLEATSQTDDHGRYWWTPPEALPDHQRETHPGGHVDLGVAHGMGGAAWLLAAASATSDQATQLLTEVVSWLQSRPRASSYGHFPSVTLLDGSDEPAARVAWCYGDLGMSVVIAQCGIALQRDDWTSWAQGLALGCAHRPDELSGVVESSLCHGSAGNALLFERINEIAAHPHLAAAASRYMEAAKSSGPLEDQGLLQGQGGVDLFLSGIDPTWEIALLARLP